MNTAAQTYRKLDIESMVESANPHMLVRMLFDGALQRLKRAAICAERQDYPGRSDSLGSAVAILDGLRGSLDHEKGGELAGNLDALYDYMQRRLHRGNVENNPEAIREVISLVETLSSAWIAIESQIDLV